MTPQRNARSVQGLCAVTLFAAMAVACNPASSEQQTRKPPGGPAAASSPSSEGSAARLLNAGPLEDFSLLDQAGKKVSLETLRGKPWVAAFFFTRCPTVCPRIMQAMKSVKARAAAQGIQANFVGFSVDPEHDTPQVLRTYEEASGLQSEGFLLLTGDRPEVDKMAKSFKVGLMGVAKEGEEHLGIMHSGHLLMVDSVGAVRGYYRSGDSDQLDRLVSELSRVDAQTADP